MNLSRLSPVRLTLAFAVSAIAMLACPSLSKAQTYPPLWTATAKYAAGDQVQMAGNVYRAIRAIPPPPAVYPVTGYSYWELNYVGSNTTLGIGTGQPFPNLMAAWTYASNARIADSAYLHLSISSAQANFNETFNAPFSLDHGSGARISIIGDNAAKINLTFSATNGFVIDSGHAFGAISELSVTGISSQQGVSATAGSSIQNISDLNINSFGEAVYASGGASINVGQIYPQGFNIAFYADQSASLFLLFDFTLQPSQKSTTNTGLYANRNGSIKAEGCVIDFVGRGAWAENGGVIDVNSGAFGYNGTGCKADLGGRITLVNGHLGTVGNDTNGIDIKVLTGGTVSAAGATFGSSYVGSNDGSFIWT